MQNTSHQFPGTQNQIVCICIDVIKGQLKKLSLYGPLGLQEFEASRISGWSAHEGGKVVSAMHQPPLPA
jgi:hypothetical protein